MRQVWMPHGARKMEDEAATGVGSRAKRRSAMWTACLDGLRRSLASVSPCSYAVADDGQAGSGCALRRWPLALALLMALPALALPEDSEQPIHIQADEGSFHPQGGVSVLTGSVRLQQGTLRVEAHNVTIESRQQRIERIVAEGSPDSPATFRQRINAGEPVVNAKAQRIDYMVVEERLRLSGDAHVVGNHREVSGAVILWDIKAGRVDASSEQPGGVRLKWQPEQTPDVE